MNRQEHCQATRLLLGLTPHPGLHGFMDEYSKELGRGHRLFHHDLGTIESIRRIYGDEGALEAIFHIACDMGLVTTEDIKWGRLIRR